MESPASSFSFLLATATRMATMVLLLITAEFVQGDPRSQMVGQFCRSHAMHNNSIFIPNFIATMNKLSQQVRLTGFGEGFTGSGPETIYGLAQCYGDLPFVDCMMCYSQARTILPICNGNDSARLYLDGCYMRSDSYRFFEEYQGPDDKAICGSTALKTSAFKDSAIKAISRAVAAAPNSNGYARSEATASNETAYVLANCWRSLNASSCNSCLNNAYASLLKCLPSSEGRALNSGCFMRYSNINFLNPEQMKNVLRGTTTLIVVSVVSSTLALLVGGAMAFYIRKQKRIQNKRKGPKDMKKLMKILSESGLNFKFSTIEKATKCFDEANKLGQGGFGVVYKGVLADGREIAVKRLFFNNTQRAVDFYNEVNIISSMEHKNLVKLLGCSFSGSESFLVYEFMPNQSLERFIFDADKGKILDWKKRQVIILGTAEGLAYLHENPNVKIIHRDIKASNVLLNSKFCPKIADFGLARSFQEDYSHISTQVVGTLGYMAPEYVTHGRLTKKADVYSFGVLLLEIATGQRSNNSQMSESAGSLVICAWKQFLQGRVEELIDSNLLIDKSQEEKNVIRREVLRLLQIGLLCTQEIPSLRPTMLDILKLLMDDREDVPAPTHPPLIDIRGTVQITIGDHPYAAQQSPSIATMSYSSFSPR